MKIFKSLLVAFIAVIGIAAASCSGDKKAPEKQPQLAKIIDFNATWCIPCQEFAPTFEAVAEKYNGQVSFESVDMDENPTLAQTYGVESIPMVVFLDKDGKVLAENVGVMSQSEFEQMVESYLQ